MNYSSLFQKIRRHTKQSCSGKPFRPHLEVADLVKKLKKNTITVLKVKEHVTAKISQNDMEAILLALKENKSCQALYLQVRY